MWCHERLPQIAQFIESLIYCVTGRQYRFTLIVWDDNMACHASASPDKKEVAAILRRVASEYESEAPSPNINLH